MTQQPTSARDGGGLTPLVMTILRAGDGDAYRRLVVNGAGSAEAKRLLDPVKPQELLGHPVTRPDAARAMLSGLWLWHDWLDASHGISQSLHTPSGSFWHAIVHRREGDFWNSKYWYARCRNHPALAETGARAEPVLATLADADLAGRLTRGGWDPDAFVDWVETLHRRPDPAAEALAVKLQRVEWRALFDACARSGGRVEEKRGKRGLAAWPRRSRRSMGRSGRLRGPARPAGVRAGASS